MANTVVSIFPNPEQAMQAREHLLATGFSEEQVDVKTALYNSDIQASEKQDEDVTVIERITDFFRDLFGADDTEIPQYARAGKNGTIITVHTETSEEAASVAVLLDSFGAAEAAETAGSYFPEKQTSRTEHRFLDDPLHKSNDDHTIASQLKSRVVANALERTSSHSLPDRDLY